MRGPYLQSVMGGDATVVWNEPGGAEGCVDWQLPEQEQQTACAAPTSLGTYAVTLHDLPRDTLVQYRARVGLKQTKSLTFRSAPVDSRPVRLMIISDGHMNESTLGAIAQRGLTQGIDAIISTGDQINEPEPAQFDKFFNGLRPLLHGVPLWPVIGNHERADPVYFDAVVVPGAYKGAGVEELAYSARFGDVWIGVIELLQFQAAHTFSQDLPEQTWLKKALASPEAQSARWRLLFVHEPPWSVGWGSCKGYHGEVALREVLLPIAEQHGVAAIFSGHVHGYEHGKANGVELFVAGGAGGGLDQPCETPAGLPSPWTTAYVHHALTVDATCDTLTVEARDLDGGVIETTSIAHPAPLGGTP